MTWALWSRACPCSRRRSPCCKAGRRRDPVQPVTHGIPARTAGCGCRCSGTRRVLGGRAPPLLLGLVGLDLGRPTPFTSCTAPAGTVLPDPWRPFMSLLADPPQPKNAPETTETTGTDGARSADAKRGSGLFRAFWRWHFYASFIVTDPGPCSCRHHRPRVPPSGSELRGPPGPHARDRPADLVAYDDSAGGQSRLPALTTRWCRWPSAAPDHSTRSDPGRGHPGRLRRPVHGKVLGALGPTRRSAARPVHADLMAGPGRGTVLERLALGHQVMAITGYYLFLRGWRARRRPRRRMPRRLACAWSRLDRRSSGSAADARRVRLP